METGKLIAFTGAKTVGKSTIAKAIAALSEDVHILSFAKPIKEMLSVSAMDQQIAEIYRNAKNKSHVVIIVDDCRFENEAAWVAKKGGQIVELYRDGIEYTHEHITEKPLPNSLIDWSFDAGGVQNCVKNIVQNILAQ